LSGEEGRQKGDRKMNPEMLNNIVIRLESILECDNCHLCKAGLIGLEGTIGFIKEAPNAQQEKQAEGGELVKELHTLNSNLIAIGRPDLAVIPKQAAAHIEELEKVCGLAYEGLCTNDFDACDRAIKAIDAATAKTTLSEGADKNGKKSEEKTQA